MVCLYQAEGQQGSKVWKQETARALVGMGRVHRGGVGRLGRAMAIQCSGQTRPVDSEL